MVCHNQTQSKLPSTGWTCRHILHQTLICSVNIAYQGLYIPSISSLHNISLYLVHKHKHAPCYSCLQTEHARNQTWAARLAHQHSNQLATRSKAGGLQPGLSNQNWCGLLRIVFLHDIFNAHLFDLQNIWYVNNCVWTDVDMSDCVWRFVCPMYLSYYYRHGE
jgi:hypothetical protein